MIRIFIARDITQAQLVVNLLEQQLIRAQIQNSHQSGGLGELAVSYPEVWLDREQDAERARAIIEEFEDHSQQPMKERVCSQCGEINPVSFDWCWACEADLS